MTLFDFIILLLIAGLCGAAGQALTGFSRGGYLASIAVGFVGALLGSWIARVLGFPGILSVSIGGTVFPIVWSILGGAMFVAILSMISGRRIRP